MSSREGEWTRVKDAHGRYFYVNHVTREVRLSMLHNFVSFFLALVSVQNAALPWTMTARRLLTHFLRLFVFPCAHGVAIDPIFIDLMAPADRRSAAVWLGRAH